MLVLVMLGGCRKKPAEAAHVVPPRPRILIHLPTISTARVTDTSGTEEAERTTWVIQMPKDSLVKYYRAMLPPQGWRIMSDEGDSLKTDLYARKDSLSLWLHAEALGKLATQYTFIGSRATTSTSNLPVGTRRVNP